MKAVTLKHVAERAGVSRSAVSRTFTEGASVSDKMRRKVEKAAQELGYRPNFLARGLSTRRTKLIGLVADNFHNPFFLQIFDLFTRGLQERELRPLLVNLSEEKDPEHSLRMLQQYSVDGVVVASSTLLPAFAHAFRQAGVPVVNTFGRHTTSPGVHIVGIDNRACGRTAAETLIERGYRHIAFMGGPNTATSTQDRLAGFLEAAAEHSGVRASHCFSDAYSFEAGRKRMTDLLKGERAEAYFCGDDVLSIGAMSALESADLQVPQDVGIIGLNDIEMAAWENINLTTIRQPIREMVNSTIELIVAMLEEPEREPETRVFRCRIVERGTLRPL